MPYNHTFPVLYDECLTICLSDIVKWKYIHKGCKQSGRLRWTRYGEQRASVSITVDYTDEMPYLELNYKVNGQEEVSYSIKLTSVRSNLNKGTIWYFVCPFTFKRCRKLYLLNGRFAHRSLIKGAYATQTYSNHTRGLIQQFDRLKRSDDAYEVLHSKYFKKFYNNKPTKRYLKVLEDIARGEGISEVELLLG